jgi:GLPGLI family protein
MKSFFNLLCLILSLNSFSQNNYKITYEFIANGNEVKSQNHILLINNNRSYFFKENLLDYKVEIRRTTTTENGMNNGSSVGDTSYISSLTDSVEKAKAVRYKKVIGAGSTITKDFLNKNLFFTAWSIYFKDTSSIQDTLNNFKWKFVKDTSKILLKQKCRMATLNWRGRDYIAWYAPKLSIFDGPYKFCGLPGLILEIYDTENVYKYVGTNIIKKDEELPIEIPTTFLTFDDYKTKLAKGIKKLKEILDAKAGINSDCTTCGKNPVRSYTLTSGVERSLYEGL